MDYLKMLSRKEGTFMFIGVYIFTIYLLALLTVQIM